MRRLYVHIGPHKTGTTYVQQTASALEGELDHTGLRYLRAGRESFGHHALARILADAAAYENARQEIAAELDTTSNDILISSEMFSLLRGEDIRHLLALFPETQPKALFLFRKWGPLLHASWQEDVKHGSSRAYPAFCLEHFGQLESSEILNFKIPIERWVRALARERVALASYDGVSAAGDLFEFVLRWTERTPTLTLPGARSNPSLDPFVTETIRALNEIARSCGYKPDLRVRERFFDTAQKDVSERHAQALTKALIGHASQAPDLDAAPQARLYLADFLRTYAAMMIDDVDARAAAIESPAKTITIIDPAYLWLPEARAALMEYWLRIMPELRVGRTR